MTFKPKKGRVYWLVIDHWEKFYTVPVRVHKKGLQWNLGGGGFEYFDAYDPQQLFRKKRHAEELAATLNEGVQA